MKKLLIGSELFFLHAKDCSDGQGMPARNVFMGCVECSGAKGCPRNGRRGATCSAAKCKADYAAGRRPDAAVVRGMDIAAPAFNEMMPSGTWIQELDEILGERCCVLAQLTKKKRKNGPGTAYAQQYLCRGKYLEERMATRMTMTMTRQSPTRIGLMRPICWRPLRRMTSRPPLWRAMSACWRICVM